MEETKNILSRKLSIPVYDAPKWRDCTLKSNIRSLKHQVVIKNDRYFDEIIISGFIHGLNNFTVINETTNTEVYYLIYVSPTDLHIINKVSSRIPDAR